ncbi:ABC transporter ATP-binding protein [Paenibacillaceae bacterium]|nr:ABC transporter ATP-binding protein [Paenibacillaceae bacterium]
MIIVNAQQIKKYHAANLVLDGVTFQLHSSGITGLIGRNGSGKSTLLRLISGLEQVDEGMLTTRKDLKIGYLPQIPVEFAALTVYEVLAYGFRELLAAKRSIALLEQQMSGAEAIGNPETMQRLLTAYSTEQERFEQNGGYEMDTLIDQVTNGLQIDRAADGRLFDSLSGGQKTRVALASQLVLRPDLLLLDEPTNHLDLSGIEWLERFLQRYEGACIIVSHDRYFMDTVATKIIELEDGEAFTFVANYSGYMKQKEQLLLQQFQQFQEQQKMIKKMKESIRRLEEWGRVGDNEKFFKRAASLRKALDKLERVKRPVLERPAPEYELAPLQRSGRQVVAFEQLLKQFGDQRVLDNASGRLVYGEKVVLLGDNGSGKTTLFKLLLGAIQPESGVVELGSRVEIGYLSQEEPIGDSKLTVLDYFRTEARLEEGEARNVLASYLFYGTDVFKPLQMLSGGEWSRLRLALIVQRKPNLLLLDEPTNHLDMASREALEEALEEFPGTILAISHDRYFINRLAKRIWKLEGGTIAIYLGNYDEYKAKREEQVSSQAIITTGILPPKTSSSKYSGNRSSELANTDRGLGKDVSLPAASRKRSGSTGDRAAGAGNKHNGANGGSSNKNSSSASSARSIEQVRKHLEQEIEEHEAELALLDKELLTMSEAGEQEQLEAVWQKREAKQSELDLAMEKWLTLE